MSQKIPSSSNILYSMISLFKKIKSLLSELAKNILVHIQKHEENQWNNDIKFNF